jgi:hypothetical protein
MSTAVLPTPRLVTDGIVVVMPAYREEANLESTVENFLSTLEAAGQVHRVVVVNDGSPDGTGEVLDRLAERYPDRVIAHHHETNRGYGAAVRSGIRVALESTDLRWLLLTDSDGQFEPADVLTFLEVRRMERADGVIGYRADRADPFLRKVNGFMWTTASRMLLRTGSRDVDCAYKLFDRRLLEGVVLAGEAAAISPELLAKVRTDRAHIIEHPVRHYPREHGEATGAKLSVVLRSLYGLGRIYADLVRAERRLVATRRLLRPADPVLAVVLLVAVVLSVAAYAYFARDGLTLAYPDAQSHLLIARRVLASPTAGAAQLGGVWLPLPHLLALPLIWSQALYVTGFAGSAVSMIAYVVATGYVYRTARAISGLRLAGVAAAGVFALNLNVLYLQSTAMSETLLLATVAAAVYHLHRWCDTGRLHQLALASAAVLAASLTRYEGWILGLAMTVVIGYTGLRRWRRYARAEASLIFFGIVAFAGVLGWIGWNAVIFGDPWNWQSGEFAKPSLWVAGSEPAVGHLGVAADTYLTAVVGNMGLMACAFALVGLIAYAMRYRLRGEAVAPYVLLVFAPFFVYALYSGQRPMHVREIGGDLYNVRFGVIMVLGIAVFAGYLVKVVADQSAGLVRARRSLLGAVAVGIMASSLIVVGVPVLDEGRAFAAGASEQANQRAAAWLREHYDGGLVLMMSFGNESAVFSSRIPTQNILYEGSFRIWERALANPAAEKVRWIYLRAVPGQEDAAWQALHDTDQLAQSYVLMYDADGRQVYQERNPR